VRAVASTMTRRHDRVVCFIVSRLCEFLCEDYEFLLNYILLFRLLYTIFAVCPILEAPYPGRYPKQGLYKKTNIFLG
jgi:hypothetical protein